MDKRTEKILVIEAFMVVVIVAAFAIACAFAGYFFGRKDGGRDAIVECEMVIRQSIAEGDGFIFMGGAIYQVHQPVNSIAFRALEYIRYNCDACHKKGIKYKKGKRANKRKL